MQQGSKQFFKGTGRNTMVIQYIHYSILYTGSDDQFGAPKIWRFWQVSPLQKPMRSSRPSLEEITPSVSLALMMTTWEWEARHGS